MYVTLSLVILNCNIFRLLVTNVTSVKNNRAVVIAILDNIIFLNYIDEFKKFAILKKGIGIESQNLCKQFNDQKTMQTRWN